MKDHWLISQTHVVGNNQRPCLKQGRRQLPTEIVPWQSTVIFSVAYVCLHR